MINFTLLSLKGRRGIKGLAFHYFRPLILFCYLEDWSLVMPRAGYLLSTYGRNRGIERLIMIFIILVIRMRYCLGILFARVKLC